jgi:6-O-methylguanine DNA methyltransferase, DNA binding domain
MAMTALEKLRRPQEVRIVNELPAGALHWGPPGATMVISTPQDIGALVLKIPEGKLATFDMLKQVIAKRHGTTITCPVTTGLFLNIVARAAHEQEMMGATPLTAWWRVIRTDGTLNERFPGGVAEHEKRLVAEGHQIEAKGKSKRAVSSFEAKLAKLQD